MPYHFFQHGRKSMYCKPLPLREKRGRRGQRDMGYCVPHLGVQSIAFSKVFRVGSRKRRFPVVQSADRTVPLELLILKSKVSA